jgi:hypothetical protein
MLIKQRANDISLFALSKATQQGLVLWQLIVINNDSRGQVNTCFN